MLPEVSRTRCNDFRFKMAAPMQQFERCDFCRLNHSQGKKHVYSKQHQKVLKNILAKFKKKVCLAEQTETLDLCGLWAIM